MYAFIISQMCTTSSGKPSAVCDTICFCGEGSKLLVPLPRWKTTACQLSATVVSILNLRTGYDIKRNWVLGRIGLPYIGLQSNVLHKATRLTHNTAHMHRIS
jgi:hypothetical protein